MSYIAYFYFGLITTVWISIVVNNFIAGILNKHDIFVEYDTDVILVHLAIIAIMFGITGQFT